MMGIFDDIDATSQQSILMLRLIHEFAKSTRHQRDQAFLQLLFDDEGLQFEHYAQIHKLLLRTLDRPALAEWLKFSLQLNVEDETIRSSLVNLLLELVSQTHHSFDDYQHHLGNERQIIVDGVPMDYEVVIDGDQPSQGEALSAEEAFHIISEQMQTFNDLAVNRETEEFLKPYSFEMLIRDSDDVCQVAVMIVKRLMSSDEANGMGQQFSREMLQIISDVVESVEVRNRQEEMEDEGESNVVYWAERQVKYQDKLDEYLAALEQYDQDGDEEKIPHALARAVYFHRLLEECKFKEKMTGKRALSLCLILLKQCRASISD